MIQICNIIGEGSSNVHREGQNCIRRKCINTFHQWAPIPCKGQDTLVSLFPLLLISDILNSRAESWQGCIRFMSISETRIECLLLPLPLPSPMQACSPWSLILGKIRLWQSWDLMSDTLGMQFFYYWEDWDFTRERGWDEWVSLYL